MLWGLASVWLGSYGAIAVSFLINILLSRTLGPDRFGHLALLLTVAQILSVGPNASLAAVVRFGASEFTLRSAIRASFWDRLALVLPWYAVGAVVMVLGAPWLSEYLEVPPAVLALLFAYLVSGTLFLSATGLLRAVGRMRSYGVALAGERIVALAGLASLWRVSALDATAVVAVFVLSTTASTIFILGILATARVLRFAPTRQGASEIWRFSLPLLASNWLGVFGTQWIDYLIIRRYLPLNELGLYALAYQLAGAVQQLVITVGAFLLPTYSSLIAVDRHEDVRQMLNRLLPYWLLAFAILLCVAIPAADVLIPLLFGPDFGAAVVPLQVLFVSTILLAIFNTFATVMTAYGTNWPLTNVVALSVTTNVVLDLALVPPFGIVGAAAASVAADGISVAFILWIAARRLRISTLRYALFLAPVAAMLAAVSVELGAARALALVGVALLALWATRAFDIPARGDAMLLRRMGAVR